MDLEPDPLAQAEVEAVGERRARRARAQGGGSRLLDDLRGRVVEGLARPRQTREGAAASSAPRATSARRATSAGTSPTTKVRVVSAQQPLSSSGARGRSRSAGARGGPLPGSWPPPDQALVTMMSAGAGAPWRAQASRTAARTRSAVSGAPSSASRSPSTSAARSRAAPAARPCSAADCALRTPASSAALLARRRPSNRGPSTSSVTPSARSRSAIWTGSSRGTAARVIPARATARRTTSSSACSRGMPSPIRS